MVNWINRTISNWIEFALAMWFVVIFLLRLNENTRTQKERFVINWKCVLKIYSHACTHRHTQGERMAWYHSFIHSYSFIDSFIWLLFTLYPMATIISFSLLQIYQSISHMYNTHTLAHNCHLYYTQALRFLHESMYQLPRTTHTHTHVYIFQFSSFCFMFYNQN